MFFDESHAECDNSTRAIRKYMKHCHRTGRILTIVSLLRGRIFTNTLNPEQKSEIMQALTGKSCLA
jgi:hypothetical protein